MVVMRRSSESIGTIAAALSRAPGDIAGEDDLDAPAACPAPAERDAAPERLTEPLGRRPVTGNGFWRKPIARRAPSLASTESAAARDTLIAELGQLPSAEKLTDW